jgi:hypothetical protein
MKLLIFALGFLWQVSAALANTDECDFLAQPDSEFWKAGHRTVEWLECRDLTDKARNQGKPLTVKQLEEVRARYARDPNYSPDKLWNAASRASMMKKVDCMIATSDFRMCKCLADELPVFLPYASFVLLVTAPSASDLSHLDLKPTEVASLYVDVRSVRDTCVTRD